MHPGRISTIQAAARVQFNRTGGGASIKLNCWGLVDGLWLGFNLVPLAKTVVHLGARGVCMSAGERVRIIPQERIPCTALRP